MRTRPLPFAFALVLGTSGAPVCGQTFSDVASSMGFPSSGDSTRGMGWADYDGKVDLYLGHFSGSNHFRNRFPQPFVDVAVSTGTADASFAQGVVLDPQGAPLPGGGPRLTLSNALAQRLGVAAR
ncbi:MAG: hypothetical protein IPN34_22905 [Planctomycetes bacterium]|nr:hypothetical protein [Planctomycetota bacterium]